MRRSGHLPTRKGCPFQIYNAVKNLGDPLFQLIDPEAQEGCHSKSEMEKYIYSMRNETTQNMHMTNIVNHDLDGKESVMGIMKGSPLGSAILRVKQVWLLKLWGRAVRREGLGEMRIYEVLRDSTGGLGACHQQAKKGRSPWVLQELFWDSDIRVHACMNQKTPNGLKIPRIKTGKNRQQNSKINATQWPYKKLQI